jgi:hypothetical protein
MGYPDSAVVQVTCRYRAAMLDRKRKRVGMAYVVR